MHGTHIPVNVEEANPRESVEGSFFKVNILEIGIHIETRGPEVICTRDVGNDTLSTFPDVRESHPHVPVPHLKLVELEKPKKDISTCSKA
jgi:hypothetical protein